MRWALLSALVSLLTVQVGLCQPPVSRDRSIVLYQGTAEALPRTPGDRADEITELKGAVLQLQQRVDQLTPSCDTRSDPSQAEGPGKAENDRKWPLKASWQDGLQIESANEEFRVHVGGRMQFDA